ncbi:chromate transporter [Clostridium amylolyticum]|uniref:Chromate transporter n=1 Tax=Clostridium amylolyticum TaxID=1121298 RepID=A0A1M6LPN2_9CLOT|nr:chromate transporter [Clostridium amylolyticum]SHJ73138.1 chromate transporter [Clostridium amylolyticum]
MKLLMLFLSFFKIGLFSFGGGYAMIPLIQKEIETNNYLPASQFADIIAIAEMTPGPIAVNSATFVGYKVSGVLGSLFATIGVALPSLIIAILISRMFFKYQNHPLNESIFYGIRPVIPALIMTAAIFVAETSIFPNGLSNLSLRGLFSNPLGVIDIPSIIILIITFVSLIKFKINPILAILGSGILGVVVFSIF